MTVTAALFQFVSACSTRTLPAEVVRRMALLVPDLAGNAVRARHDLGHSLDFDDTHAAAVVHPGAPVIPAALAAPCLPRSANRAPIPLESCINTAGSRLPTRRRPAR